MSERTERPPTGRGAAAAKYNALARKARYTDTTHNAVLAFQRDLGLAADGIRDVGFGQALQEARRQEQDRRDKTDEAEQRSKKTEGCSLAVKAMGGCKALDQERPARGAVPEWPFKEPPD